jgi:hypothetical protein
MQIFDSARAFIAANPYMTAYVLVAVVSISLRIAGSAWWAAYKGKHPALAGTIEVARGLGFDAPKILQGILRIAEAMLPPAAQDLAKRALARFLGLASAALAVVALALPAALASCSSLPSAQTV